MLLFDPANLATISLLWYWKLVLLKLIDVWVGCQFWLFGFDEVDERLVHLFVSEVRVGILGSHGILIKDCLPVFNPAYRQLAII